MDREPSSEILRVIHLAVDYGQTTFRSFYKVRDATHTTCWRLRAPARKG